MKRISFLTIAMLFFTIAAIAQSKEVIKFNETTHDFGTIKEEDGRVTTTFKFDNICGTPIFIKNVRASCGCTSPKYSREPIAPNASGEIDVTYSAAGRPGHFQKSVTITLSNGAEDFQKVIFIKGKVTPRAQQNVQPAQQARTVQHVKAQPAKGKVIKSNVKVKKAEPKKAEQSKELKVVRVK